MKGVCWHGDIHVPHGLHYNANPHLGAKKKKKEEKNGVDQEALLWPSFLLPLYELEYASY